MKDQALILLRSLPTETKNNIKALTEEVKQLHAPSLADKWRKTSDIRSHQRNYPRLRSIYAGGSKKAVMNETALVNLIIPGLKLILILCSLCCSLEARQNIFKTGGKSEVGHYCDQMNEIAASIKHWLANLSTPEVKPCSFQTVINGGARNVNDNCHVCANLITSERSS
jgi:hypothetical protein